MVCVHILQTEPACREIYCRTSITQISGQSFIVASCWFCGNSIKNDSFAKAVAGIIHDDRHGYSLVETQNTINQKPGLTMTMEKDFRMNPISLQVPLSAFHLPLCNLA